MGARQPLRRGGIARYALEQYRLARRLLDYGEYVPRIGAELATATGWLSNTAAWLVRDSGRPDLAQQCLGESVLLAEQHGDTALLAAALGDLANVAIASPARSREPVRLACRASELAKSFPSRRLNALRAAEESTAYAAVGDRAEFERAIVRMWREVDRGLDGNDDPAWLDHVTDAELTVHEARGRRLLGQHHRAATLFHESLTRPGNLPGTKPPTAPTTPPPWRPRRHRRSHHRSQLRLGPPRRSRPIPRLLADLRPVRAAAHHASSDTAARFRRRYDRLVSAR